MKKLLVDLVETKDTDQALVPGCEVTLSGLHCFCGANFIYNAVACCFCDLEDTRW